LAEAATGLAPRRWGLGDVAVGLIPFAISALSLFAATDDDDSATTLGTLVAGSLFLWIFLVGVPVVATRLKGNGPVRDLGFRLVPSDIAYVLLGVFLQAVVVWLIYWPILKLLDRPEDDVSSEAQELIDSASGGGIAILILFVCVGAPIAEELFFRGLLLRAFEKRYTLPIAVVASTVLFALTHFQGIQFPALLLFGAVASVLAARTGRLGPSIFCHIGFNAWTVAVLL
jgi:uncharacterized protein